MKKVVLVVMISVLCIETHFHGF